MDILKLKKKFIFSSQMGNIKVNKDLLKEVQNKHPDIKSVGELAYILKNGIEEGYCYCGNKKRFETFARGYVKYCSQKCAFADVDFQKRAKITKNKYHIYNATLIDFDIKAVLHYIKKIKDFDYNKKYIATKHNQKIFYDFNIKFPNVFENIQEFSYWLLNGKPEKLHCICGKRLRYNHITKNYNKYCSVKCSANDPKIRKTYAQTCIDNYGVSNPMNQKYVQLSKIKSNRKKYGVDYPLQSPEIRKKIHETHLKKYGSITPFGNKSITEKSFATKRINKTFNTSTQEEYVFNKLKELYVKVKRQYKSKKYPYYCDFYIPSLDLYIEYQGVFTHGIEPFLNTKKQQKQLKILKQKSKTSKFYKQAINVWTKNDVEKRTCAKNNNLNWIEFFTIEQFDIWYKNQKPLKYIKGKIYNSSYYKNLQPIYSNSINGKVLYYQWLEFYKTELKMWKDNKLIRGLPLRSWLYANRIHYINKGFKQLSSKEILRAFKISGIHYGYSHFSTKIVEYFLSKYKVDVVYDPCGGWGHRLLSFRNKYIYNDINKKVVDNCKKMAKDNNIDIPFYNKDASKFTPIEKYDAIFTCPPYHNLELYSKKGIENKSYKEYLKWWSQVVKRCLKGKPKYFCFVMSTKYIDDLINICKNNKLKIIEKYNINNSKSHFGRKYEEKLIIMKR